MADMGGWTPVPARPVVTESEIERAALAAWGYCARDTDRTFLEQLGVEVIKDPVPSDEEKLAELIDGHIKSKGITPESLARYLTLRGVKAPDGACSLVPPAVTEEPAAQRGRRRERARG